MYTEIKTNNPVILVDAFKGAIEKGQHTMLTLKRDGDFYVLSLNQADVPVEPIESVAKATP
jgi:hypothetical protein